MNRLPWKPVTFPQTNSLIWRECLWNEVHCLHCWRASMDSSWPMRMKRLMQQRLILERRSGWGLREGLHCSEFARSFTEHKENLSLTGGPETAPTGQHSHY